ncbi:alpha/beta hydrolase, partial [Xanthomonas phaseoli]
MHAPELKPGNAARIYWQQGAHAGTPLVVLYLHGFSASPGEAGALPEQMADALSANGYVHRWPGHGLAAADAMQGLSPAVLQASALEALAQAQRLGERVAIVGSSMGATLGLWLAAQYPDAVAAVVAWSPGIRPADPALLEQICAAQAPLIDPRTRTPAARAFWSETIHPDGFRALRGLFERIAADPPWPRV